MLHEKLHTSTTVENDSSLIDENNFHTLPDDLENEKDLEKMLI